MHARSERVAKTKIDGTILKEAKHINLSLHYLEQVIVCLHEKSQGKRTHIPYRNSMMTSLLRDSLGGNCKTSMIATLAVEQNLLDESISTCRFAQRVAMIRNTAMINEEVDLRVVVERLKRQVELLKSELALARGEEQDDSPLPDYEKKRVRQAVDEYLVVTGDDETLVFSDFRKIQEAFRIMKEYVLELRQRPVAVNVEPVEVESSDIEKDAVVAKMKRQITQRDHEISITFYW
jgi:kinesin family protein 6/9